MKKKLFCLVLSSVFVLGACSSPKSEVTKKEAVKETEVATEKSESGKIVSEELELDSGRDTKIPTSIVLPEKSDKKMPLVVFAHGFMGSRDEAGGFTGVAEELGKQGIASIRIDFPGCNDSKDETVNFNLENNTSDVLTAIEYMKEEYKIDDQKTGMLGYSMGGRVTSWVSEKVDLHSIVLWAPGISEGNQESGTFGSPEQMKAKIQEAQEKGFSTITFFDNEIKVGEDLLKALSGDQSMANIKKYQGNALMITGAVDEIVPKAATDQVLKNLTSAKTAANLVLPRAGHGMGVYEKDAETTKLLIDSSANFFADQFNP